MGNRYEEMFEKSASDPACVFRLPGDRSTKDAAEPDSLFGWAPRGVCFLGSSVSFSPRSSSLRKPCAETLVAGRLGHRLESPLERRTGMQLRFSSSSDLREC